MPLAYLALSSHGYSSLTLMALGLQSPGGGFPGRGQVACISQGPYTHPPESQLQ